MSEEMRVPVQILNQKGHSLYMFAMNSALLRDISYVVPKSRDDPQEIQRGLDDARLRDIGKYVKLENSLFPNNIVLNLSNEVQFVAGATPSEGTLVFPSKDKKVGYILDGQHRLYGFKHSGGVEFDLPVVALKDVDPNLAYKIFADINSKQQKVSPVLLELLLHEIGDLAEEEDLAVRIVHRLNNDADSVLKEKIRVYPEDKKTWLKAPGLVQLLQPIVGVGGPLQGMPESRQTTILKNYFRAFSELYSEAWTVRKGHVLTKYIGFYLTCGLFERIYRRCQLYEGGLMEVPAISRQLEHMGKVELIEGAAPVPLDWKTDPFARFVGRKGMNFLRRRLLIALPERDPETEDQP